jgi:DNA-binding PadR family transcriptional regulator
MSDPQTLILLSLANGPLHGYGIQQRVLAQASVRLGPGTLYGAVGRLEQAGFIAAGGMKERRRPYRITPAGRAELTRRLEEVRVVSAWAKAVGAL